MLRLSRLMPNHLTVLITLCLLMMKVSYQCHSSYILICIILLDFNPDTLEAKDAKEEYDSDPSDTGSETDEGSGSGSEGEKSKRRKVV